MVGDGISRVGSASETARILPSLALPTRTSTIERTSIRIQVQLPFEVGMLAVATRALLLDPVGRGVAGAAGHGRAARLGEAREDQPETHRPLPCHDDSRSVETIPPHASSVPPPAR